MLTADVYVISAVVINLSGIFMKKLFQIVFLCGFLMASNSYAESASNSVKVPFKYALGKSLFEKDCSSCHGVTGTGTDKGPTFMHAFYKPNHHGDASFYRAAMSGVKAHHWKFGDMLPVEGMTQRTIVKIVPYIRWMQVQNGIQ